MAAFTDLQQNSSTNLQVSASAGDDASTTTAIHRCPVQSAEEDEEVGIPPPTSQATCNLPGSVGTQSGSGGGGTHDKPYPNCPPPPYSAMAIAPGGAPVYLPPSSEICKPESIK